MNRITKETSANVRKMGSNLNCEVAITHWFSHKNILHAFKLILFYYMKHFMKSAIQEMKIAEK